MAKFLNFVKGKFSMRRIVIILFTVIYILPAIGFSINVHWCGNKVSSITIETTQKNKCACGKKMKQGCCKDTHTLIKLTDNQKVASTLTIPSSNPTEINVFIIPKTGLFFSQPKISGCTSDHAPPYISKQPVYLSCNVFRI